MIEFKVQKKYTKRKGKGIKRIKDFFDLRGDLKAKKQSLTGSLFLVFFYTILNTFYFQLILRFHN